MIRNLIVLTAIIVAFTTAIKAKEYDLKADILITKLAEIDSKIDLAILKKNYDEIERIDFTILKKEIEELFLNSKISQSKAKMIWMYSGKIYLKTKKLFSYNSKDFRLAPSDYQNPSPKLEDIKKVFLVSKWLYISSKR